MSNRRVIALLVNNAGLRDDYQGNLRRGVETACVERDLDLWVYAGRTDFSDSQGAQLRVFDLLSDTRIDGIVVAAGCIATGHSVEALFAEIRARCDVPICAVGQECAGIPSIMVDNRRGERRARRAPDHARRKAPLRIHRWSRGTPGIGAAPGRLPRRARAARADSAGSKPCGMATSWSLRAPRPCVSSSRKGSTSTRSWRRTTTWRAALARRCSKRACAARRTSRSPASTTPAMRVMRPALTTVRQPVARMGALAVARLIAAWGGRGTDRTITLSTDLVVRESCGCHAARSGDDARVHDAARRPAARGAGGTAPLGRRRRRCAPQPLGPGAVCSHRRARSRSACGKRARAARGSVVPVRSAPRAPPRAFRAEGAGGEHWERDAARRLVRRGLVGGLGRSSASRRRARPAPRSAPGRAAHQRRAVCHHAHAEGPGGRDDGAPAALRDPERRGLTVVADHAGRARAARGAGRRSLDPGPGRVSSRVAAPGRGRGARAARARSR